MFLIGSYDLPLSNAFEDPGVPSLYNGQRPVPVLHNREMHQTGIGRVGGSKTGLQFI